MAKHEMKHTEAEKLIQAYKNGSSSYNPDDVTSEPVVLEKDFNAEYEQQRQQELEQTNTTTETQTDTK